MSDEQHRESIASHGLSLVPVTLDSIGAEAQFQKALRDVQAAREAALVGHRDKGKSVITLTIEVDGEGESVNFKSRAKTKVPAYRGASVAASEGSDGLRILRQPEQPALDFTMSRDHHDRTNH